MRTSDAAGAPPSEPTLKLTVVHRRGGPSPSVTPCWPYVTEFRHRVREGLGRTELPAPRLPHELSELETEIERVGLDVAVACCVQRAREREARAGRIGTVMYFLPLLREMNSRPQVSNETQRAAEVMRVDPETCPHWGAMLAHFKERLRPDLLERWFLPLHAEVYGDDLLLTAPDRFHASFVEDNYGVFLLEAAQEIVGLTGCVRVSVQRSR